jgi:sortase (surface protein transpeptidase)
MSRLVAVLGAVMLAAGIALLAQPTAPLRAPDIANATSLAPTATATTTPTQAASATQRSSPTPLPPIPPGYRVQIPRLGIDLEIREGDVERDTVQQQTPEHYAFHLPGTGIPGSGVNSYVYAHARIGMFLSLWNARVGDAVIVTTPDGSTLRYTVTEIHPRVPFDDVSWTAPSPPDRLTLQTSTGPNPGDPRFVVIALPA